MASRGDWLITIDGVDRLVWLRQRRDGSRFWAMLVQWLGLTQGASDAASAWLSCLR